MRQCSYPECHTAEMKVGGVYIEPPLYEHHADLARAVGVLSHPTQAGQFKIITIQNVIELLGLQMPTDAPSYKKEITKLSAEILYFKQFTYGGSATDKI